MSKKQAPSKQQPVKYLPTVLNAFRQGFILLAFLVYLLGPANAAPVQAAVYTWTAYNDCVGTTGGNTTAYTVSGTTSGLLRNYETGANTPVTVTVTRNGSINTATSSGAYSNSGTDAYNTFNGRANMAGVINYASSNGWYVDLTFTGLDPTKTYTFATTANRADSGYTSRVSQFTISDITAATNASTSGVTVVSNESVAFSTGYNTVNGYVARWTGIQPGSDGDFAVRTNAYPFNSTYYGYGPSVFMLAEEDLSPNITTSGALTAFTAMPGEESATQTFSVSGENLTQDITITAPEGFQLSTDGSSFSSTLTLRQTGGIVATTTVYARLYSATEGSFSGNITLESTGAVTRNIAVSGVVSLCPTVSLVVAEDTHMRSGSTRSSYNYGGSTTLRVNPYYEQGSDDGQLTGALLKWDIAGAGISDEVQVSAASLTFNVTNGSNYAYGLYNMRRAWVEGTNNAASGTGASWNYYGAGTGSWGTTGAQNTETDRYNTNLWDADASDFNTTGAVTFDLNASGIDVVQGWIDGTITNNGLTIQNYSGTTVDVWEASSSEATTAANRPRLNVTYCYPTDPTIRAVGTLNAFSSQPGVPSAPQSYTVSGRNLNEDISIVAPANFEISTSSDSGFGSTLVLPQSDGTVAATPVYVRFNRATIGTSSGNIVHSSAGATVVNKAVSGTASNTASVTFQYGAGGYTGTVDTFIRGTTDGNTNYGANTGLEWDENSGTTTDEVALVRFNDVFTSEGGVIPDGATILSATLTYMTTDLSGSSTAEGDPANVYESLVDWDGSTVTWNTFGGEPGVQADEYYATLVGEAAADAASTQYSIDVTSSLQRWSEGAANYGWIFLPTGDDGVTLYSSDHATVAYHPLLSVTYTTDPVNRAPNQPVLVQPADDATGVATSPVLQVTASDPNPPDLLNVQFFGRPQTSTAGPDFTLIVLPDIQNESQYAPEMLNAQMNWIVAQQTAQNIVFVTSVGDLVNTPSNTTQFNNADAGFDILDAAGIPYSVGPGNHDMMSGSLYNNDNYFGTARFTGRPWYGGYYGSDNYNNYSLFSASGNDFILINLQYTPTTAQIDWADSLLKAHPDRRGIVVQHDILNIDNSWNNQTSYTALRDNPNLFIMLCGHMHASGDGAAYRSETGTDGHTIHIVLADYQDMSNGNGWLRILRFSPENDMIYMTTYSPYTQGSITTSPDQMDLVYDLAGNGEPYTLIDTAYSVINGANATITWPGLAQNTTYEWYTVVTDGLLSATSPTWSFTTGTVVNQNPVITEESPAAVTMSEDGVNASGTPDPFSLTLHATDADATDTLTWSIAAPGAANGTAAVVGAGTGTSAAIAYTPNANYNGADSFVVQVSDGNGGTDTITVNVTINPVNDLPVANAQAVSTNEDVNLPITLTGSDVETASLTFSIVDQPSHGTLSGTAPNLTYDPADNYFGTDSFTFRVNDGTVDSAPATVSITLNEVNDVPVANAQAVSTDEDTNLPITLTGSDVETTSLTFSVVDQPLHGTLSGTAPNLTYDPADNYFGTDSFTFRANDGTTNSTPATVSITIVSVNDAPVCSAVTLTTVEDTAGEADPICTDVDNLTLTFSIARQPAHGAASVVGGSLRYMPDSLFNGTDSFTYTASDGDLTSNAANVAVTVSEFNNPPIANAQAVETDEDVTLPITLTGSDAEGSSLTFSVVTQPQHGTLIGTAPNLTYDPADNYSGTDSFTFRVNDGTTNSAPATVSITINPVNDVPLANGQSVSTNEDVNLPITLTGSDVETASLTFSIVDQPLHGTLSGTAPNLTYDPVDNYFGTDSFTFRVNDGTTNSAPATVSITIVSVNDAPVCSARTLTTAEDTPGQVAPSCTDVENQALTFSIASQPANGSASVVTGSLRYVPDDNYNGGDSFTYTASDGNLTSNAATVTVTVAAVNDAPVANAQAVSTDEDTNLPITLTGSDPDHDPLTFSIVDQPLHGTLSGTAPNLTYDPADNYFGTDSFTFRVNDGTTNSAPATVSITIVSVNDAPVCSAVTLTTAEDTAGEAAPICTDVDNLTLTFSIASQPTHGAASVVANMLRYAPTSGYTGIDSFTYTASDGNLTSNAAAVSVTITDINTPPTANAQTVETNEDVNLPITLTGSDPDHDPLTFSVVDQPSHGTLSGTAPNLTYDPADNYFGADSFTFRVNDGTTNSAPATVSITINPVNDVPVANGQSVSTNEDVNLPITLTGSDVETASLTFSIVDQPLHGTLNGTAPNLTYDPADNYSGTDSFTFRVNDGTTNSAPATVSITINPVNDVPVANGQSVSTNEDVNLPITLTGSDVETASLIFSIVDQPLHGTLSGTGPNVTYEPADDYFGEDSFTFRVNDGTVNSNIATVSITVNPVNDAPVCSARTLTTAEDMPGQVTPSCTDVDNLVLTFSIASQPTHGTASIVAGVLRYTPQALYSGADSFTYTASDGNLTSNAATVSVTVSAVNDTPVADAQAVETDEDVDLAITLTGSDEENSPLTFSIVDQPQHGTLSGTAPNLTYAPDDDYAGADSFTFRVNDGSSNSATATVAITVNPINDAPTAVNDSYTTPFGQPLTISADAGVLANDSDVDSATLSVTVVDQPASGTLVLNPDGSFTYTPAAQFEGTVTFTYVVSDGEADSNIATVEILVQEHITVMKYIYLPLISRGK